MKIKIVPDDIVYILGLLHTSSDLSVFFDVNQESSTIVSEKSRVHVQNQMGTTVVDIQQEKELNARVVAKPQAFENEPKNEMAISHIWRFWVSFTVPKNKCLGCIWRRKCDHLVRS